jgi:hypothetical protein
MSDYQSSPISQTETSPKAIISLVASILSYFMFPIIGSIVGIILGNQAQQEIHESGGALTGEGMARAGVILGWINLALSVFCFCTCVIIFVVFPLMGLWSFSFWDWDYSSIPILISLI